MEIKQIGQAGTIESSDVRIIAKPNPEKGIIINLESVVKIQFGDAIKKTIIDVLSDFDVKDVILEINDKGAHDHVIRSRMQAVLLRAAEISEYDWERA